MSSFTRFALSRNKEYFPQKSQKSQNPSVGTTRANTHNSAQNTTQHQNQNQIQNPITARQRVRPTMTLQLQALENNYQKPSYLDKDKEKDEVNDNNNNLDNKLPAWAIRSHNKVLECPNCKNGGSPMADTKNGRTVCQNCGLVLDSSLISEGSEWRSFADSDKSGPDPNRVGSAGHYLMGDDSDLSTKVDGGGTLQQLQDSTSKSKTSSKLMKAVRDFESVGQRLNLKKDARNCSGEIFRDLSECEDLRQKKQKTKEAVCMYMAAKMCNCDRPLKEVCQEFGVDPKSVRKLHFEIQKLKAMGTLKIAKHRTKILNNGYNLRNQEFTKQQSTEEIYALQYANKLQCDKKMFKPLRKIIRRLKKFGWLSGKQPATIASACLFLVCIISNDTKQHRSYKEISAISGASENTIASVYRKTLHPNRRKLIPDDYGDAVRVENLPLK